ncbi:hypothetical protein N7532_001423 [Penicillium argentinense]|uniref:Integrase catalytic domain-containing protein n=1 Tax=Penicillium argentinense TaxID=1131581 RepID=A0A9W9G2J9_9EURO|nr:uncharacterized protein N7532_001423 [Penicillium argentinense]KAJ5110888.1 hypothetical protein N7532_001423 [Penicillium argentinense]
MGVPTPLSGHVPMNLIDVSAGSVSDLDDHYLPPEWKVVDVDGLRNVGFGDMRGVHYRSTTKDVDSLPPCRDHGDGFIRPKSWRSLGVPLNTLYKRKADKVLPMNVPLKDGSVPEGRPDWQRICLEKYHTRFRAPDVRTRFDKYLKPRIAEFARGARLTPEREGAMIVGKDLMPEEKEMLRELLFKREGALAWSWEHMGRVREEVYGPQVIRTVEHEAWQEPGFMVPRALHKTVIEMLEDRLKKGTLEPCHGAYRNPWFLVKKKAAKKFRLVIAAMKLNSVTIRDANMPPNIDEFAEDFAGMQLCSVVDLFSGYDQITLDERCRDLTAIMTPLGLLRATTILQGAANSVPQCQRVVQFVLSEIYGSVVEAYLDDFGIKGPKTDYNGEMALPGVRRYVLEHLQNLDHTLYLLELAGMVISAEKSQFVMQGVAVVGWICDASGRRPDEIKVAKLVDWPTPTCVSEVRSFVGLAVYFRVVIAGFAMIIAPLYKLMKSGAHFQWGKEQQQSFDETKRILSTFPVVLPIDYEYDPLVIVVAVDSSASGWGSVMMQVRSAVRKPARYESGMWSETERFYDAGKRECRGVLKALKKFRHWLYGVHFTLEIDAKTLVAQLNRSATDLPGALVTSWIAWIRLFDFDVHHVPGRKHGAADALSRRPYSAEEIAEQKNEEDVDEFILAEISTLRVMMNPVETSIGGQLMDSVEDDVGNVDVHVGEKMRMRMLDDSYSDESEKIAQWCVSIRRPSGMSPRQYNHFKKHASNFVVQGEHLFYRGKGLNMPLRRVLDGEDDRKRVVSEAHDGMGHKGREATYALLKIRYWWEGMYTQVAEYVRGCPNCQFRNPIRVEEPLLPNRVQNVWDQVFIDTAALPDEDGYRCMVQAREALSGWVEAKPLKGKATGKAVCDFIWQDIICRYGWPLRIVMDKGPEFRSEVQLFLQAKGIKRVAIAPYNAGSNGAIERSMRTFKDAISKMTHGYSAENAAGTTTASQRSRSVRIPPPSWRACFYAALLADRMTVCATTGMTPFRFLFGRDAILPLEAEVPTWSTLPWETITTREDLISLRGRQILQRDADVEEAIHRYERMRENNKAYFDSQKSVRSSPLEVGNLVLLHDTQMKENMTAVQKLRYRWHGPYRIREVLGNGAYALEELDGTPMFHGFSAGDGMRHRAVNGDRLKRFWLHRDAGVREQSFPPVTVEMDNRGLDLSRQRHADASVEDDVSGDDVNDGD